MFQAIKNHRRAKQIKKEIANLERKLARSNAGFVQAVLNGREPDEDDIRYHNEYTGRIEELRQELSKL